MDCEVPYRSKNHHFVPQVLQRQFAAKPGHIWYSERGEDGTFKSPQLKEIDKAFRISNFYTVLSGDVPSDVVEKEFYGRIDGYLGKMLPKVLRGFEQGVIPTFSGIPLDSLRKVVVEMAKRTPEFTEIYDETAIGREVVESTLAALPNYPASEERRLLLAEMGNPSRLREIGRSLRVRSTIVRSALIENALEDFAVRWAFSGSHHSFLLSSLMVYRIGNGGSNGLSNPNMEMWMPISPKIALVLARDPKNLIPLKVLEDSDHIRQVNEYASSSSRQIASHSKLLLESLTGKKALVPRFNPASSPPPDQTPAPH
jgi:Protein of unknown function (DUF4238)